MADKLGLLAGQGDLPKRIIEQCVKEGRPFHIIAFNDQTDKELVEGHPHTWVRMGAAGKTISILKEVGATTLLMAGRINRPSMLAIRPDAWALKVFAKVGKAVFGDDGILKALINALEDEGFKVIGAEDILDDMLATHGTYGKISPDDQAQSDIQKAMRIAHIIGAHDVGQAVVVQAGLVLAVEAIEGTDRLLERCIDLKREGPGGVLVKAKKPNQEQRADLPTIGVLTVQNSARAGLRGIAIEANGALIIDKAGVIREADELGLFVIGIKPEGL
jgi:UDP-2,3-diacylglucosamine hydrolase